MNLNKEPIYQQLTRILRQRIADGYFHPCRKHRVCLNSQSASYH
ncbi:MULTISPECIES: hypothetical protein [unclassified Oceanispirochaeta]|nr:MULTISPECIES: hypothetical protein [unclassified Oceanispirochaeta]